MFRRTFWFTTGVATGVWATLRAQRALRRVTPESIAATAANRAVDTGRRALLFAQDVRTAMAEREDQLNDVLGLSLRGRPAELPGQRAKAQLERKAARRRPHDRNPHHRNRDLKEDH
ncbi:DUF6167 family protein [Streptomyces sp. MAR4 CNX-425]|uniref:DUF6167 family protein n=1 Tax=Streptomyces sp. MAR4 CNX-425 TaxID=3406343 RepID=UPI003B50F4A1